MNKKMLTFIPLGILAVSLSVVLGNQTTILMNSAADVSYSVTLDSNNAYVSDGVNTVLTANGNEVELSYENATSQSGMHVALGVGGAIKNTTQITGIKNVLVNYTGELTLGLGLDGVNYKDATISDGVAWVADEVTYNFFTLTATSSSVIESVVITYSCMAHETINASVSILEGGLATESGITYTLDDLPVFSHVTNPAGLATDYWFSKNDGAINLGKELPEEVGTYAYNAQITEIGYAPTVAWVWFVLEEPGITPTITITVAGEATSNGQSYYNDALPEFDFEVDPIDAPATYWYSKNDGAINLGQEAPTEPGTYAYNVKVEGEGYITTQTFIWYNLLEAPTEEVVEPTITFSYKGNPIDIKGTSSHWINGGYANSIIKSSEFSVSDLTWEVSNELEGIVSYTKDDVPIASLEEPLEPGTYCVTVSVNAGEYNTAASEYVLFVIKADGVEPTIEFFYKGEPVAQTGNGWFNISYVNSQIECSSYSNDDFTWTVTPDVEYVVSYTLNEAPIAEIDPTVTGSYCIRIDVPATEDTIAGSRFILFALV